MSAGLCINCVTVFGRGDSRTAEAGGDALSEDRFRRREAPLRAPEGNRLHGPRPPVVLRAVVVLRRGGLQPFARALYLACMWLFSLALSSVFLWSSHAFYGPYARAPRTWGFSALADQRLGGGVMLLEGSLIMLGVLIWLGLRWFEEGEARQRLLEPL